MQTGARCRACIDPNYMVGTDARLVRHSLKKGYDYIIVGAGTAGCVLANRLSADPTCHVLLCEAGPRDSSWILHMPAGLRSIFKPTNRFNWWFETTPQPGLDHRRIAQPRGKTLGGSSSINGMTFLRGNARDYDEWEAAGCPGWSYAECLPYFRRSECYSRGPDEYRGADGPVGVQVQEQLGVLNQAFLDAGLEAGFPFTDDPNGAQQEGFCRFDMSVWHGRRSSAARSYLHPVSGRPNLDIVPDCLVNRVLLDGGRATGVELYRNGYVERHDANCEVVLSAGAFGSPQILMLSGIGPGEHLRELGIDVRLELPGVGENLQDHLEVHVQVETDEPVSLNRELQPHRMLLAGIQWFGFRTGVASVNQCHVGAFLRTREGIPAPDVQFHFFPVFFDEGWLPRSGVNGYRLGVGATRPTSRGSVRLRTRESGGQLQVDPNYLATERDRTVMREGVRLARETLAQPSLRRFHKREDTPGSDIVSDRDLDRFIRQNAASAYHPCGTCRMGPPDDHASVVAPDLRVHGIDGLRVVDASIMPDIVRSNINAPVFMIAERAAEMILGAERAEEDGTHPRAA